MPQNASWSSYNHSLEEHTSIDPDCLIRPQIVQSAIAFPNLLHYVHNNLKEAINANSRSKECQNSLGVCN